MPVKGNLDMHPLSLLTSTNLVIYFHNIYSINWFRSTLRTIKNIYNFIRIEDIESCCYDNKKYNNRCHICFDDGDITVYKNAFPVLREMNVPATLFVSPKVISDGSNY
ncbi:MAG: polysaccharide deacetylase family protein [Actinobacteria bacterium]|nr:polysaccharide deacetylase family protein [Actinomycetota bacterium]